MNELLERIKRISYNSADLKLFNFKNEQESQTYGACRFDINGQKIICRNAKITPTKIGQFVAIWKRSSEGTTIPMHANDEFNWLIIIVQSEGQLGQFVFPKSVLIEKGIITSSIKEGKRGFRIYPSWDTPMNKQAINSQNWQLDFFIHSNDSSNRLKQLFNHV